MEAFEKTVLPGYTEVMKTAISVPDDTYEQATRQAAELGISRSEFFARAARRYLDELASRSLTQQVNEALQTADDDSTAAAVRLAVTCWQPGRLVIQRGSICWADLGKAAAAGPRSGAPSWSSSPTRSMPAG